MVGLSGKLSRHFGPPLVRGAGTAPPRWGGETLLQLAPSPSHPLWTDPTSLPRSQPSLSSYLCRIKRKNSSCSACGHPLQDQTHLFLDCLASEPLQRAIFDTTYSIFDLWSNLGAWPDCGSPWSFSTPPSLGRGQVASPPPPPHILPHDWGATRWSDLSGNSTHVEGLPHHDRTTGRWCRKIEKIVWRPVCASQETHAPRKILRSLGFPKLTETSFIEGDSHSGPGRPTWGCCWLSTTNHVQCGRMNWLCPIPFECWRRTQVFTRPA